MTISDNELYCGIWHVSLLLISIYYIHKHIITDKKYEKDWATTFQDYFVFCTVHSYLCMLDIWEWDEMGEKKTFGIRYDLLWILLLLHMHCWTDYDYDDDDYAK